MSDATDDSALDRLRRLVGRVPPDVAGFVVIAFGIAVTHWHVIRHGIPFNDSSWYFHFGRRTLHGDVPYRDYVFQAGPLPIYVDAAFQKIVGSHYTASLYAGLFVKILRVSAMFVLVRRLVDWRAAALLAVFCALDPSFAFVHHWNTSWSSFFTILTSLFLVLAAQTGHTRYLVCTGFAAAMISSARQSCGLMTCIVLFAASSFMLARKEYFTRRRYLALWGGCLAGFVAMLLALAAIGALGPAIQEMFIDAAEKKGVHGIYAVLDALSGGSMTDWWHTWWGGFLLFLGLPAMLVAALFYLTSRDEPVSTNTIGMLVLPVALIYALLTRDGSMIAVADLPRVFFEATTIVALLWPARMRAWFGLEPIEAIALGTVPMASDWAMELSFPGRGWGDATALVIGIILFTLASRRLTDRTKTWICAALACAAVVHTVVFVEAHRNPFALHDAEDGTLDETSLSIKHPIFYGMKLNASRKRIVEWLDDEVKPGSSCFVYANLPILYDITDCKNPTHLDSTIGDYPSYADAVEAARILRANPPDYIIAHDAFWTMPAISNDTGGVLENYGGLWNTRAIREIHMTLRSIIDQYDTVGLARDVLGPELSAQAHSPGHWDTLDGLHLYRLKRLRPPESPVEQE